ncbi:MAG: GNAT family N-acetyltransferase [Actinomycetia bacterium]|nr:GNAT family N-acetyltransferase [Actinomycetes bacterium]
MIDHQTVVTESRPSDMLAALHESGDADREYLFAYRDVQPDDLVLVAWLHRRAVGYLVATDRRDQGLEIWEHLVLPQFRHRGVGRTLMSELARRAVPESIIQIDPAGELDLDRVADYYGGLGFTHDSERGLWATVAEVAAATAEPVAAVPTQVPLKTVLRSKTPGVVTIDPDLTVRAAVDMLNEHRIGALVVSSDGSRIEGIFSERDVLLGLGDEGAAFLDLPLHQVTIQDVVTCTASDPVARAMELMTTRRIRHVPVTETGRLVGIISIGDLLSHRLGELTSD